MKHPVFTDTSSQLKILNAQVFGVGKNYHSALNCFLQQHKKVGSIVSKKHIHKKIQA